jgi:DNA-binding transcriptional ArsR family regulator
VNDDVFHALANATRRRVLRQLTVGPATVSELAAPFDMALPSFMQHMGVLERSRLVKSKKHGRVRTYEIAPERFKVAEETMSQHFAFDPKTDFVIDRFIDAPRQLVWEALTKPEHLKAWYMPKAWGRVSRAEMDLRPGGVALVQSMT